MKVCTFFGHRIINENIEANLLQALVYLIENQGVSVFYVGNNGQFDRMVRRLLKQLSQQYSRLQYHVVLAYLPQANANEYEDYSDTIYPDGLERTPKKFAIAKRNRWMIDQSEYVVTYVRSTLGGAAKFKALAESKGKTVINI